MSVVQVCAKSHIGYLLGGYCIYKIAWRLDCNLTSFLGYSVGLAST